MLGFRSVPTQKLTALRFGDDASFRKAARVAAEEHIPVDAPGHRTLVVQLEHVGLFEKAALKFDRALEQVERGRLGAGGGGVLAGVSETRH